MNYQQHPLSAAFPVMNEGDYMSLLDSISNIGVQNPITLYEGMVLDGWNRFRAAMELGCDCPHVDLGDVDPRDFVLAQNKARRHVTAAQLAMATASVYQWKPSHREKGHTECDLPAKTNSELAEIAGVHPNTITQAKSVQTNAVPEVQEAVRSGQLGLPKAAEIAKLPKSEQAAAIKQPVRRVLRGKPKKGPRADVIRAELKAAGAKQEAIAAHSKLQALEEETHALRGQLEDAQADIAWVGQIMDAGDPLAAALKDAEAQRELARGLQARIDSMMTEIAELKRSVKHWQKKAEQPA